MSPKMTEFLNGRELGSDPSSNFINETKVQMGL